MPIFGINTAKFSTIFKTLFSRRCIVWEEIISAKKQLECVQKLPESLYPIVIISKISAVKSKRAADHGPEWVDVINILNHNLVIAIQTHVKFPRATYCANFYTSCDRHHRTTLRMHKCKAF